MMATFLQPVLVLMVYCLDSVISSAAINIRLQSYKVDGKDFDGRSCDYWISWWPACDPKFKFCIDDTDGEDNSFASCSIASYLQTEHYDGNDVTFPAVGALPGNRVSNPLTVSIPIYNGFKFKTRVMDDDTPFDDLIDIISYTHTDRPARRAKNADWESVTATGNRYNNPSSLSFEVKVYCEENYYGPECDKYCVPVDSKKGHYTCDPESGDPICRPGWENEDEKCLIKKDNCRYDPCKNGGKCVDLYKGYICTCPTGFTGKNCGIVEKAAVTNGVRGEDGADSEDHEDSEDSRDREEEEERRQPGPECYEGRCRNGGTCVSGIDGPICICRSGYEGTYCDQIDPDVNRTPIRPTVACYNGGRPEMHHGEVHCRCPQRFVGLACDVDRCSLCSCKNYSFCPNYREPSSRTDNREQSHHTHKSIHQLQQTKSGYNYQ